jgi:hypothetical protein
MSRHLKIAIVLFVAAIGTIYFCYPYTPAGRQALNMASAERHIPKVRALIGKDARFRDVWLAPYTGFGGSLTVSGYVDSTGDLTDLKRLVESTEPPVNVSYGISVGPKPAEPVQRKE